MYVSLLRGVNVGGRIIKMADLKMCYEQAGFTNATTLLQSGNVVFASQLQDTEGIRAQLEAAIGKRFGYDANVFVLEQNALRPLIDAYPFNATDEAYQHYIIFVRGGLGEQLIEASPVLDPAIEAMAKGKNVVYWRVRKGMTLKSTFGKLLGKPAFSDHTNRNIKTVRKLAAVQL